MRNRLAYVGISLLSACGGGEQMAVDLAPDASEASPDAGVNTGMDADQQPLDLGCSLETGRASILAVLHNADGSIKSTKMTDGSGQVSWEDCPADSMISYAKLEPNTGWHGATVSSVQPGDHFEVMLEDSDVMSNVMVSIPIDNADVSFIHAQVGGRCSSIGAEGAVADVSLKSDCVRGAGSLPVLASGKIAGIPVYSYGGAASIAQGGSTVINNMTPWTTGPQVSLSASNIPGTGATFYTTAVVDSRVYGGAAAPKAVVAGSASAVLSTAPSGFTTTRRLSVSSKNISERGIARETTAFSASFDMSTLLPEIEGLSVDDSNPSRPLIGFAGNLSAADVGLVFIEWTSNAVPVHWRLVYRASTTNKVLFPDMPVEFSGGAPANVDMLDVTVLDVTGSSYADILTRGYHFYEYNHDCPELPAGSECLFVTYSPF